MRNVIHNSIIKYIYSNPSSTSQPLKSSTAPRSKKQPTATKKTPNKNKSKHRKRPRATGGQESPSNQPPNKRIKNPRFISEQEKSDRLNLNFRDNVRDRDEDEDDDMIDNTSKSSILDALTQIGIESSADLTPKPTTTNKDHRDGDGIMSNKRYQSLCTFSQDHIEQQPQNGIENEMISHSTNFDINNEIVKNAETNSKSTKANSKLSQQEKINNVKQKLVIISNKAVKDTDADDYADEAQNLKNKYLTESKTNRNCVPSQDKKSADNQVDEFINNTSKVSNLSK